MAVRAKFFVTSVMHQLGADGEVTGGQVSLHPVYAGEGEDRTFWDATPSGRIELNITNRQALDQFRSGQKFYIDFTPAEN
jgi:hypothetical protein